MRMVFGRIPEPFKAPFRRLAGRPHPYGLEWQDRQRMEKASRFTAGTIPLFGKPFAYADAASFLSAHTEIFVRGIYAFSSVSPHPFVIDGGANVGLASLFFKRLNPRTQILAFEADPGIADIFEANLHTFGLSSAELRRAALWDSNGSVRFTPDGADGGRIDEEVGLEVPTVCLSEAIGDRRVDLLKLDIEGAETRVLVEAETSLSQVERIFVEYHAPTDTSGSLSVLLGVLERSGFRCYLEQTSVFLPRPLVDHSPPGPFESHANIFAWRVK